MIYIIRAQSAVKIGYTANQKTLRSRMATLQCAQPYPLDCLATFAGSRADEAALHSRFASKRLGGEWFVWDPGMQLAIADLAANGLHRCEECDKGDSPMAPLCVCVGCGALLHERCASHVERFERGFDLYCLDCYVEEFACEECGKDADECVCAPEPTQDEEVR